MKRHVIWMFVGTFACGSPAPTPTSVIEVDVELKDNKPGPNRLAPIVAPEMPPPPPGCDPADPMHELYEPTARAIEARPINHPNSAARVQQRRGEIQRVEIAHETTHRISFELSGVGLESLREPSSKTSEGKSAAAKDWPVVLLVYVEGEQLPYLGHVVGHELYFFEDDPWVFSGERAGLSIPIDDRLRQELEAKLGPVDPEGKQWADKRREDNLRCGRLSEPPI